MLIIISTSSSVNSIYITSPLGKAKKKFYLPGKGSNRHRFGVLRISCDILIIIAYYRI